MVAILVLLTIITCLTIDYFAERAKLRRAVLAPDISIPRPLSVRAPVDLTDIPAGIFLGRGHSWMSLEPAGQVRVGVDRLPLVLLGQIDEIEAVPAGTELRKGERLALLRQGDKTLEVKSPVDGRVEGVNIGLTPERLLAEPFGAGWIVRMEPRELPAALRLLHVAEEAKAFLRGELANLRDFLAGLSLAGHPSLATATLPDGGLPVDGLARRLSPEEWQELTERFF